jgi:K+/H+ antiporter YhaU regulatory subunit KhtT
MVSKKSKRQPRLRQLADLTPDDIRKIQKLRISGLTTTAISKQLGATIMAVVRAEQRSVG